LAGGREHMQQVSNCKRHTTTCCSERRL